MKSVSFFSSWVLKWAVTWSVIAMAIIAAVLLRDAEWGPEALGVYALLYFRPELFIVAAYAQGQSQFAVFVQVWLMTATMTLITWFITGKADKMVAKAESKGKLNWLKNNRIYQFLSFKASQLGQRFTVFSQRAVQKFISFGRYCVFIPFAFPIIPSIDTAAVIATRLMRLRFGLLILFFINTAKMLIIMGLCYKWF